MALGVLIIAQGPGKPFTFVVKANVPNSNDTFQQLPITASKLEIRFTELFSLME